MMNAPPLVEGRGIGIAVITSLTATTDAGAIESTTGQHDAAAIGKPPT